MTTPNKYETYIAASKEVEEINSWNRQSQDDRVDDQGKRNGDKFVDKLQKYAWEQLDPALRPAAHTGLSGDYLKAAIEQGMAKATARGKTIFSKDLEALVSEMPDTTLERLAVSPDVAAAVPKDNKEIFGLYQAIAGTRSLLDRYKKKESLSEEERKVIDNVAQYGVGEAEVERLKKEGYVHKAVLEGQRGLAMIAVKSGVVPEDKLKDYVEKGFGAQISELQKKYEEKAPKLPGDKPDTQYKAALEAVRGAVKKMATGDLNQFETAYALVYAAHNNKVAALYKPRSEQ